LLGTSSDSIDIAEDRKRFDKLLTKLDILRPENGCAMNLDEAKAIATSIGYPVLVRPSYVLGGRAMEIVYDEEMLTNYMKKNVDLSLEHPILIDQFLEDAIEIDVDSISDGKETIIAGIMEHIEEAGIHSGDSACVLPPFSISEKVISKIKENTKKMSQELHVIGLMNVQYAVKNETVYVLEVNPRASRTIPFVSKATGVSWAKMAARIMGGKTLKELKLKEIVPKHVSIKEVVLPFIKFTNQDVILGPEMKSTGEVMGISDDFGQAFAKAQFGAWETIPTKGRIFISVTNKDKKVIIPIAKRFADMGFDIIATKGTAKSLTDGGVAVKEVKKVSEGRPNIVDEILSAKVDLVINTPQGRGSREDEFSIRREAISKKILVVTTISAASALASAVESLQKHGLTVKPLQEYFDRV